MKKIDNAVLNLLAFAIVVGMFSSCAGAARAQTHTPQQVLFYTCLHEASIPVHVTDEETGDEFWARTGDHAVEWGNDCWMIHEVFLMGASRLSAGRYEENLGDPHFARLYVSFALAHSEGVFNPIATDTNRWAARINTRTFAEPEGWARETSVCVEGICTMQRTGMRWSRARRGAMHAWELAGQIIANGLDTVDRWTVCREPVDTWGGRMDHDHAVASGFIEVTCDPSANTGYAYPSRVEARSRS